MLASHYDPSSGVHTNNFSAYNSSGQIILSAAPSAVSGYSDTYADLLHKVSGSYAYLNASSGLITVYAYYTDTTANEHDGGRRGRQSARRADSARADGRAPSARDLAILHAHGGRPEHRAVATDTVYRNSDGTGRGNDQLRLHLVQRHGADAVGDGQPADRLQRAERTGHGGT